MEKQIIITVHDYKFEVEDAMAEIANNKRHCENLEKRISTMESDVRNQIAIWIQETIAPVCKMIDYSCYENYEVNFDGRATLEIGSGIFNTYEGEKRRSIPTIARLWYRGGFNKSFEIYFTNDNEFHIIDGVGFDYFPSNWGCVKRKIQELCNNIINEKVRKSKAERDRVERRRNLYRDFQI